VGDELVARVHDVGVAARPDLDLRDDAPDVAQAHLRRRDLDGVLADGDGERRERL
jgi:hypothetical protein